MLTCCPEMLPHSVWVGEAWRGKCCGGAWKGGERCERNLPARGERWLCLRAGQGLVSCGSSIGQRQGFMP